MGKREVMTLGGFIDRLEAIEPDTHIVYVFGAAPRMEVESWRGSYSECALPWECESCSYHRKQTPKWPTAAELAASLRAQIGGHMTGYKGGTYTIGRRCEMHCALHGASANAAIVGVSDDGVIEVERHGW